MNEIWGWLALSAFACVLAAWLVYLWQGSRLTRVNHERSAALQAQAVAEQRFADLDARHETQSQDLQAAQSSREQLVREVEALRSTSTELQRRVTESSETARLTASQAEALRTSAGKLTSENDLQAERLQHALAAEQAQRSKADAAETALHTLQQRHTTLTAEHAALTTRLESLTQQFEEQKNWTARTLAELPEKMIGAASSAMEERGKVFSETNKSSVLAAIEPFKELLAAFHQRVNEVHTEDARDMGHLRESIKQLAEASQTTSRITENLTRALTTQPKAAGNWGETVLARILEDSGLRVDHEYRLQSAIAGIDGERLHPDAIVDLPEKRHVIIDSKVSIKSWSDHCAADSDETRTAHLKAHLLSLRAHVKDLADKDYSRSPDLNTVDFVLMFVPVEAALLTALAEDQTLYADAYQSKIILVTPTTLMAVIKLIDSLWKMQRRRESAEQIADTGRKLYEKLVNFAETFTAVGRSIEQSQKAYEQARNQLSTGRGNAIRLAEGMRALGVSPAHNKQMPPELLADESEIDEEIALPMLATSINGQASEAKEP